MWLSISGHAPLAFAFAPPSAGPALGPRLLLERYRAPSPRLWPRPEPCATRLVASSDPASVHPLPPHPRGTGTCAWVMGGSGGRGPEPRASAEPDSALSISPPTTTKNTRPVVLQAGVCPLRVAAGGRGRGLGPVDPVGRLQQNVRRRRVLFQPPLRQPQVSPQDLFPGKRGTPGPCRPLPHLSLVSPVPSRPTIGGKYCLGERRRHRSCNTEVSALGRQALPRGGGCPSASACCLHLLGYNAVCPLLSQPSFPRRTQSLTSVIPEPCFLSPNLGAVFCLLLCLVRPEICTPPVCAPSMTACGRGFSPECLCGWFLKCWGCRVWVPGVDEF